jgi:uncharacterized membrane protein YhaH (DUF805 family)
VNWYLKGLKQYAIFDGRARRKEYWLFSLFHILICVVLATIGAVAAYVTDFSGFAFLAPIYLLGTLVPMIALGVRRLHDVGKSGWWHLLSLVPFGGLVMLVFALTDSQSGSNEYGPNPKMA